MSGSMEANSPNAIDEGNSMMSELQSNMPKDMEINNTQEEDPHSQELVNILRKTIQKSVQKVRAISRAQIAENLAVSPTEPQKTEKRLKATHLVAEQTVNFCFPEECKPASFKDIDMLLPKLGDWKIQIRQRNTKMCDTYYYHGTSSRLFRSITEVMNYMLPKSYMKVPSRKRSKGEGEKISAKLKKRLSPCKNSQHIVDKKENLESSNISFEFLQGQSEVHEHETHVEAIKEKERVDVESLNIGVPEEPRRYPECINSQHTEDKKENLESGNSSKEILQNQPEVHEHETHVEAIKEQGSVNVEFINIGVPVEPLRSPDLEDIPIDFSVNDYLIDTFFY